MKIEPKPKLVAPCPFCSGEWTLSVVGDKAVGTHTTPACQHWKDLNLNEFTAAAKRRAEMN